MQCNFAEWEIRNLGCRTIEITLEKNDIGTDIIESIEKYRRKYGSEYVVVKISPKFFKENKILQDNGYFMIENQIGLKLERKEALIIKKTYDEIFKDAKYVKAENIKDIEFVKKEIKKGIFTTDRIALDDRFGVEKANERYSNWLQDEVDKKSLLYIVKSNDASVAFFLSRPINDKLQYGILGGVFLDNKHAGAGAMMTYCSVDEFINSGRKYKETGVSSNNITILKLYLTFGYKIKSINNILVKHY